MGKHKKTKRLSIERTVETESPDLTKDNKDNKDNKDDKDDNKGCKCCGVLDCFKIETNNKNNINGNNNVVDNNKETSLNIGVNTKK
jgi:hypothetical protein